MAQHFTGLALATCWSQQEKRKGVKGATMPWGAGHVMTECHGGYLF